MKWRTHSNLVVNCDVVSWASCAHKQEFIKLFFIRRTGRQAGGRAGNDSTFSNYVTFSPCKGLHFMHGKENLLASWFAVCSIFGLLFGNKYLVCCLVVKHFPQRRYHACDLLKPEGSACVPLLVYFICSWTRLPRLWVVKRGNSCIWLQYYCWLSSSCDRKGQSYLVE